MNTINLDGKVVAKNIKDKLSGRIDNLLSNAIIPHLAVILIGNDPASKIYVNSKHKTFNKYKCKSTIYKFEENIKESDILALIDKLNDDDSVHGILVQLPIPKDINLELVMESISPLKDVDGFHPFNLGKILEGNPTFIPCTPHGCIKLLEYYKIPIQSKHVVIIGRSNIVGKPLMVLLSQKFKIGNATTTICHTGTPDISKFTLMADILIVAAGIPHLVSGDMIKDGVDIIDVGINRINDSSDKGYHITGDVDYDSVLGIANSITPVPGGIGPLTISMLLNNTVESAEKKTM